MNERRIWTLGAVAVAALLLFAGYFLGVSPQLVAASTANSQRQSVDAQNALLAADLVVLKKDFEDIDRFKAVLAEVSAAVPDNQEVPRFVNQIDGLATVHKVQVDSFAVGEPKAYSGAVNAQAMAFPIGAERRAREAAEKASITGDANDVARAALLNNTITRAIAQPFESAHVTPQNFVAIPISIGVKGDYNALLDFVASLQNGVRLTLINNLSFTQDEAADGVDAGAPAAGAGYTANLSGYIYVLMHSADAPIDQAAADAAVADAAADLAAESAEPAK